MATKQKKTNILVIRDHDTMIDHDKNSWPDGAMTPFRRSGDGEDECVSQRRASLGNAHRRAPSPS